MAERDLVGTVVVARYRVVARLATGATGDVYEAEHVALGTRVALKVLHAEHADSDVASRFLREGKTLGMFRHRNIVELLEVGRLDDGDAAEPLKRGTLFLATELVRGLALRTLMSGGPLEPRRALGIARQVLDALGHAHAMGVVHRDIRPENILIATDDGQDVIKMLDFGVAKLFVDTQAVLGESKLTKAGVTAFGDPRYIAPECVQGGTVDARADLYSVGAVLYELLTGQPPFTDADPNALMRLHAYAAAPRLDQRVSGRTFTPQIEHVVSDALAKKPDLRFASAMEMASAIDAATHSLDVLPVPPPPLGAAPARPSDDSFNLLAQDLLSRPPAATDHSQPIGAPGHAPLPAKPKAFARARAAAVPRLRRLLDLARKHRMIVGAVAGTLVLVVVIVVAVVAGGGSSAESKARPDLVKRATELVNAGTPKQAVELLEGELVEPAKPADGAAYLLLGHARFAVGRRLDALASYERAIVLAPKLASDAQLRANATAVVDGKDPVAAVVALDLLATRVEPRANDLILTVAATSKVADVRRRALAIAEREGLAGRLDRVASLSLDLAQSATCEERRVVIGKLRATADKRALAPLKRAKVYKCVERDATDAIAELETK